MSATLGAGGELERITGVPSVHRIPVPQGWDKQSTGRRLFVFPERSFLPIEYEKWLTDLLASTERSLVLTPHGLAMKSFLDTIAKHRLAHKILTAQDVEETLDPFTATSGAVLALTGRYDGIDLPGDTCRVLVVYGLPTGVNIQERFLWSRLKLTALLKDWVKTRITQAVGRCTRHSTDYAVVVMVGDALFDFCVKHENREDLHPELRAEIDFGLENSAQQKIDELTTLIGIFLKREKAWSEAESDITKRRDETPRPLPPYVSVLRGVVPLEVEYQYALWREDYETALDKTTRIIDKLSGDELAGYRALWNYFAGCAALQLGNLTGDKSLVQTASDRFTRASQAVPTGSWFARLADQFATKPTVESQNQHLTVIAAESVDDYLTTLGTVGERFDKAMTEYAALIKDTDAKKFDRGLTELGKMLGFDAEKPEADGAPDSVWRMGRECVLLYEAKADETPQDKISISTCRQAQGHYSWERARPSFTPNVKLYSIIITPRTVLDKAAVPHSENLYCQSLDAIRQLFREADACLRLIRSKSPDLDTEKRLRLIQTELATAKLTPETVVKRVTSTRLLDIITQ